MNELLNAYTAAYLVFLSVLATALVVYVVRNRRKVKALKAAQEAASNAEALMRMAGTVARMGAWKVELPSRRITWSDEVCAIHDVAPGYTPSVDEAINYYAPEYRELIRDRFEECVREGTRYDLELQIITARNRRRWVRAIGEALRHDNGVIRCVQGAFQDITALKAADEERSRMNQRLWTTLESITDAFFTVDHGWRFTYLNKEGERLLKRGRETVLGRVLWDEFPEAVDTEFYRQYRRAAAERCPVFFTAFYAPIGIWVEVNAYPSDDGLTIYFRDVTERKKIADQLHQQAALLDAATDAIIVHGLDHRIRYVNRAAERLYGWRAHEMVGACVQTLLYSADPLLLRRAHSHLLASGEWAGRIKQRCRDGSMLTVEGHWTLVRNPDGSPQAVLAINTDVRDRLELEARLAQTERLEALGQLTGGLAHDFNNLLTAIIGSAELLQDGLQDSPRLSALVHTLLGAAEQGAELTSRLLAFARRQDLEPKVIHPAKVIEEMRSLLQHALGRAISLRITQEPDAWHAYADPVQLSSAVLNLCINARDAMPGAGKVDIHVHNCEAGRETRARAVPGREYVVISVSDTGHGMSKETLSRAFEPFFTTKERGKGTGLGLSMVYGFARQSGGHLEIDSEVGAGTRVTLFLPRAAAEISAATIAEARLPEPRGRERVLVVEDDELVAVHVTRLLEDLGYRAELARSAREALDLLNTGRDYNLVLTDIVMPGDMDGADLALEVKRMRPSLPVLLTSGNADGDSVAEKGLDAADLLRKPYRRADLAVKLRDALGKD